MQVKSFTYERSWYGTYHRQRIFSMQRMDTHIARMLGGGWEILTQTAHSGQGSRFRPFAKRDTITISFSKNQPFFSTGKNARCFSSTAKGEAKNQNPLAARSLQPENSKDSLPQRGYFGR
jgi:hypothetical protein